MRHRHPRVYFGGRHYPTYAPKILWHRFTHWAIGPLLGCSCSRCFRSRWRIEYSNAMIDRFVKNERKIRELEERLGKLAKKVDRAYDRPYI